MRFPSPDRPRKKPQTNEPEEDQRQGTNAADIRALAKEYHPDDCRSGGADSDKSRVDGCCGQVFDGFRQEVVCRHSENDYDKQGRPPR